MDVWGADPTFRPSSILADERRQAAVLCLRLLDTPPEERFDRITRLVAAHIAVPIAAINLLDAERQWTKAHIGLAQTTMPRAVSLCSHVITADAPVIVPDLAGDPRFQHHPLVVGAAQLRFYAGVPLRSADGSVVGTLCVADTQPRAWDSAMQRDLEDFAAWAEREVTTEELSIAVLRQQAAEDALILSEARAATVLATLTEGVVVRDATGTIVIGNASAERILGLSRTQLQQQAPLPPTWRTIHPDGSDFPIATHPSMVVLRTGMPQRDVRMGVCLPDGQVTWLLVHAEPLYVPVDASLPMGVVTSFIDITWHQRAEQAFRVQQQQLEARNATLMTLATTDGLTGIANKRTFTEQVTRTMTQAQPQGTPCAMIMLDVDHFKAYNDRYGHPAGDAVLAQVAQILQAEARSTDLVARYGGEEFAILCPATTLIGAHYLAERCCAAVRNAVFVYGTVTISCGIAALTATGHTGSALVAQADAALYQAKRWGRDQVMVAG